MQVYFTTSDFGDEAASRAAAEMAQPPTEKYHLYGTVVLEHTGQPRLSIYDDLPFLVPALCVEAATALEQTGVATANTIDWPGTIRLTATGDTVDAQVTEGGSATFPCVETIAALRGCAARFAEFLDIFGEFHPQFAAKAAELRAVLPSEAAPD
ncbi:MAG: hypothetical protein P4M00_04465 [Azospirillaceae bacterium]|nr:hypothetical protein [Azospirillaceae bacterium]